MNGVTIAVPSFGLTSKTPLITSLRGGRVLTVKFLFTSSIGFLIMKTTLQIVAGPSCYWERYKIYPSTTMLVGLTVASPGKVSFEALYLMQVILKNDLVNSISAVRFWRAILKSVFNGKKFGILSNETFWILLLKHLKVP